ncbi:ACP S-malonyltransferase [Listeria kieliensis]|uniref:Malonyl CoA-acyl carrier protein transacylase n=1 Tax=Listeria kieliensis TaxID=1621700 RepID=A0A3D8TPL0_9LIST|nr:ACP S-malonyltransferase [Listeria kieliensis]RDX00532.1 malonyl CoA-ACP transacylase [Listeria kieliensis]
MNKLAFVFPGQGSQKVGMGQDVSEKYPEAKAVFDQADEKLGFSLTELISAGPQELLTKSENAQPALVATSAAILRVLEEAGIKADYAIGHSLGEYSALVAADFLTAADAVYLVHQRGKLMEAAVPDGAGAMAAVLGLDAETIESVTEAISLPVQIANYNCPGQIVISGSKEGIEQATEDLKEKGAKRVMPLAVSGPFHSELMKPAAEKFADVLKTVTIQDGAIPVINNVDAALLTDKAELEDKLVRQIYSPVRFEQSIRELIAQGVDTFVEIGAGKVASGLIKKIDRDVKVLNASDVASLEEVIAELKGGN